MDSLEQYIKEKISSVTIDNSILLLTLPYTRNEYEQIIYNNGQLECMRNILAMINFMRKYDKQHE